MIYNEGRPPYLALLMIPNVMGNRVEDLSGVSFVCMIIAKIVCPPLTVPFLFQLSAYGWVGPSEMVKSRFHVATSGGGGEHRYDHPSYLLL